MSKSLRNAIRMLRKNPAFTIIAICSLAIGIGATSAMFSFADALMLRPLPVAEPSQVVAVSTAGSSAFGANTAISYPDYRDLRDLNRTFDGLVATSYASFGFSPDATTLPKIRMGAFVSGNFFRVLGVQPAFGRAFLDSEDQAIGRDPVVILGHDFWISQFGGKPSVVGSKIRLNGIEFTVVGVAPERFTGIDNFLKPTMFVPLAMSPKFSQKNDFEKRDNRWLTVKGRLKPGVTVNQAQADLSAIATRLAQMYPDSNRNQRISVQTELQMRVQQSPPDAALVAMLFLLALCVLLVACANVTGLLLSRARARSREIAVRMAIGAGRGALIRQLLFENLLLAILGGSFGIAIAYAGANFFNGLPIPTDLPLAYHVAVDRRMLIFTIVASVLSTLVFGLAPALQTTRLDLVPALKAGDADTAGRRRLWGRNLIVVGQVSLSLILLVISAILLQGFRDELTHGPGFRVDHIYLTSFNTEPVNYSEDRAHLFYKQLLERTRSAPGVKSAALTANVPLIGGDSINIVPEGYQLPRGERALTVFNDYASDGYFNTMGIPILQGRGFLESDQAKTPMVAVVNEQLAKHYWPKGDALGKRFHLNSASGPIVQIVGIAKDSKHFWIAEPPLDFVYLAYTQHARPAMTIVAESAAADASNLSPVLREVVRGLDPNMPVFDTRTMKDIYEQRSIKTPNMITEAVAGLGLMGFALAVVGLYGLITYQVSRRTREIGVRMAIGADRQNVVTMILKQGLTLGGIGVAIGLVVSFLVSRLLTASLWLASFGHVNYLWFAAIAIPLLLISVLACYPPARSASLVDPMRTLRQD